MIVNISPSIMLLFLGKLIFKFLYYLIHLIQ
jgi:hypothetical protein